MSTCILSIFVFDATPQPSAHSSSFEPAEPPPLKQMNLELEMELEMKFGGGGGAGEPGSTSWKRWVDVVAA